MQLAYEVGIECENISVQELTGERLQHLPKQILDSPHWKDGKTRDALASAFTECDKIILENCLGRSALLIPIFSPQFLAFPA